jgi:hypothetical protein
MPAIVRHARKVAARQGAPASHLPHIVRRTAAKVARSPQLVRRMAQTSHRMRTAPGMGGGMAVGRHRRRRHQGYGGFGGQAGYRGGQRSHGMGGTRRHGMGGMGGGARGWGSTGGTRSLSLQGPVRIIIESM